MKKLPDKAEIVAWIVTTLGPLRQPRSDAEASAAVERMIETLRVGYRHPRPAAAFIRKAAKNFRKALEPLSDAMPLPPLVAYTIMEWILVCPNGEPVFIESCDRKHMTLREFRSALDWFGHADGPPPKFEAAKYCAALYAYRLVKAFSQKPPSTPQRNPSLRDVRCHELVEALLSVHQSRRILIPDRSRSQWSQDFHPRTALQHLVSTVCFIPYVVPYSDYINLAGAYLMSS